MHALSGYLEFPEDQRQQTLDALRDVLGPPVVDVPNRFRFFECWDSVDAFEAHQAQPYETAFMEQHVSRITGFDAHVLDIGERRPALGG
jgi:quinol monooxygenase YgiN